MALAGNWVEQKFVVEMNNERKKKKKKLSSIREEFQSFSDYVACDVEEKFPMGTSTSTEKKKSEVKRAGWFDGLHNGNST